MEDVTIARALHVLGVIHWIGGVAFITLIVLPLAASRATAEEALALFKSVEQRFSAQVRISIPLVGATGLWMAYRLNLWSRFVDPHFWWMGAMLGLWLVFMLIVFVLEPLMHESFEIKARHDSVTAFHRMALIHMVLLALATITAFGAVAGAHGLALF
ncbi:MAG: hypothetical protein ACYC5H_11035 [Methylovirgula sp.]